MTDERSKTDVSSDEVIRKYFDMGDFSDLDGSEDDLPF